jgi:type II secretory pathway component PulF
MPLYKYKAIDSKNGGGATEILIEAESQDESMNRLRSRGFTPIKFLGTADGESTSFKTIFERRKSFDPAEFTNRLLPLLKAQIQLERALGIIAISSEDETTSNIVQELRRGLHEGKRFSALIKDKKRYFPPVYANMIEAGEESGALPRIMEELQKFLNERKDLKNFLINSMIYPIIILVVTFGVLILLFTVLIPKFAEIFESMGEIPFSTKIMLGISKFMIHPVMLVIWGVLVLGIIILVVQIKKGGKAREWFDNTMIKLPLIGPVIKNIDIARFIRTMAVLLHSYVPILNAVIISEKVIQNNTIKDTLSGVTTELRGGAKLSQALAKSPYISKTVVQMLSIGEETGNVAEMLSETAELYENEIKNTIKKLLALFEPVVILFLAVIVLMVVLSIFMAMQQMLDKI